MFGPLPARYEIAPVDIASPVLRDAFPNFAPSQPVVIVNIRFAPLYEPNTPMAFYYEERFGDR